MIAYQNKRIYVKKNAFLIKLTVLDFVSNSLIKGRVHCFSMQVVMNKIFS